MDAREVREYRNLIKRVENERLLELYFQHLDQCRPVGKRAPPPRNIQQFVQLWRELRSRGKAKKL
jgi:uracil-DNA glycosylase